MFDFTLWLTVLIIFALMAARFGADSRELDKTLNSMEPVRPQI
jgi:hypothetical protein